MSAVTPEQIEALVRERKVPAATRAIAAYAREHGQDGLFQACDWYRRLGRYVDGFRLLSPSEPLRRSVSSEEFEGRRLLWAARLLNLMGASEFALQLVQKVRLLSVEAHRIVGNLHLTQFAHEHALPHFERMAELERDPSAYSSRMARLGLSDCLAGIGRVDEAVKIAREIRARSPEPLAQGICFQAEGEYWALAGRWREASTALRAARAFYPEGDRSPDMGILLKWSGYVRARLGDRARGIQELKLALSILREPRRRPEAWLDVLRLMNEVGELDDPSLRRLRYYPGAAPGFRKLLGPAPTNASRFGGGANEVLRASGEYLHLGKRYLGLPLEVRALSALAIAGPWGVNAIRLMSTLWPDQAYSFSQLETRLHQLLRRLRAQYDFDARIDEGVVRATSVSRAQWRVIVGSGARPSFLAKSRDFVTSDLGAYYELSKTQSVATLNAWSARGWIERVGGGRSARYRILQSSGQAGMP